MFKIFLMLCIRIYDFFFFQASKHNASLYAHVFIAHSGYSLDPNDSECQSQAAFERTHRKILFY